MEINVCEDCNCEGCSCNCYPGKAHDYIDMRIKQLNEERDKCSEEYDRMWFNKTAQELEWVREMLTGRKRGNCVIDAMVQQDLF